MVHKRKSGMDNTQDYFYHWWPINLSLPNVITLQQVMVEVAVSIQETFSVR